MTATSGSRAIVDRVVELGRLDGLIEAARDGTSGVLALRGVTGIGKTALLERAIASASGLRVLRVTGVEAELGLAYSSLHHLLLPLLDGGLERLPAPQLSALSSAFGRRRTARAPSRFLVGLAVLTLLSNAAEEGPILCVIDDADLLDDASSVVLAFTARRLDGEGVLMLFALADGLDGSPIDGLPTLDVGGLNRKASRELLDQTVDSPLDSGVRERLAADLDGNPLALLEVTHELTADQLSAAIPLPEALPLSDRLEATLMRQARELPGDSQRLLLLIASERSGEPDLIWRAADRLGIARGALSNAEVVLHGGSQITFRHGLVRAALYASASEEARRDTHLALAASLDPATDSHRAAWHRAAASAGPDEAAAADLEEAAESARRRGGHAAAGAYLEVAARLSPDDRVGARRRIEAAEQLLTAGRLDRVTRLLTETPITELDDLQRARSLRLRGRLAVAQGENGHTSELLLQAATALESFDVSEARSAYLQALMLAAFAGRLGSGDALLRAATAARSAPAVGESASSLLLDGLALLFTEGHEPAAPVLRRGLDLARVDDDYDTLSAAYQVAHELWDDEALHAVAKHRVDLARTTGALADVPNGLTQLAAYEALVGRLDVAELFFGEADEIAQATGNPGLLGHTQVGRLLLTAWRGEEERARDLAQACIADATARGLGIFVGFAQHTLVILELGLGNYEAALSSAEDACLDPLLVTRMLPDLVWAAAHAGRWNVANEAVHQLRASTQASDTEWGLGVLARSQALVNRTARADGQYRQAIEHLKRCRAATQLAGTRLVYGEWLRRHRRRRDAREQLGAALVMFEAMGARAFARRAQTELAATGARTRPRRPDTLFALTPHELRIASLVSEGGTNAEIAAQLYISPRTVEYHLGRIYKKLGVSSRTQLAHALLQERQGLSVS